MILVSNNVQDKLQLPANTVIRINMAWVTNIDYLNSLIEKNKNNSVFLDFPQGRSKPPRPVLTLAQAFDTMNKYANIKYFAVSNIENTKVVKGIQEKIPSSVEFVPKIETHTGVLNLQNLITECKIKTIMLDKEDLFVDVEEDNNVFFTAIETVRNVCKSSKVRLLELQGVIFIGEDCGA